MSLCDANDKGMRRHTEMSNFLRDIQETVGLHVSSRSALRQVTGSPSVTRLAFDPRTGENLVDLVS